MLGMGANICLVAALLIVVLVQLECLKVGNSPNIGPVRVTLFASKTRREITGRSCPLGVHFDGGQNFTCACVTGVWAFYDIPCAPPFQIIAGINHCFQVPAALSILQVINLGNPTRALGDALTLFDGELSSVRTKFYRETHSRQEAPQRILAVGRLWTLYGPNRREAVCLDSTENGTHLRHDGAMAGAWALTNFYCLYTNVSGFIQTIVAVSPGCFQRTKRIRPERCFPYLEPNGEEVCSSAGVLSRNESMGTTTTISSASKSEQPQRPSNPDSVVASNISQPVAPKIVPETSSAAPTAAQDATEVPEIPLEATIINLLSPLSAPEVLQDLESGSNNSLREERTALDDAEEPATAAMLSREEMDAIYQQAIENEQDFLKPKWSEDSNSQIFALLMDHRRVKVKEALKLSEAQELPKSNMERILEKSMEVMVHQCPHVSEAFLEMATDTFARMLRRSNHQYKLVHNMDVVMRQLDSCKVKGPPYNFVQRDCMNTEIPQAYQSGEMEPVIETVWKLTVHTLIYCHDELTKWVNPATEVTIAFSEMLSSEVNLIWLRNRTVEEEYGGVLGDVSKLLTAVDTCVVAAAVQTGTKLTYGRPPYKPTRPSVEDNYLEEPNRVNEAEHQRDTRQSAADIKNSSDVAVTEALGSLSPPELPVNGSSTQAGSTGFQPESTNNSTESGHHSIENVDLYVRPSSPNKIESRDAQNRLTLMPTVQAIASEIDIAGNVSGDDEETNAQPYNSSAPNLELYDHGNSNKETISSVNGGKIQSTEGKRRRRRHEPLAPEQERWRKQRQIPGVGYCLKKFDEPKVHFGFQCP